jgi:hypothetical protein
LRASTQYKFVYLANPKCASTSFRKALDPYADIRSIPFVRDRQNPKGGPDPADRPDQIYNHSTAAQVKHVFGLRGLDWADYFTFTTIRNPWARVWSTYKFGLETPQSVWHKPAKTARSFLDFILSDTLRQHSRTIDVMTQDDAGVCLVDTVIKVEELNTALPALGERLGMKLAVPHLNRTTPSDYTGAYDDASRDAVAKLFGPDIEAGNYRFE